MIRKANKFDIKRINTLGNKLHKNFEKLYHIDTEINDNSKIVLVYEIDNLVIGYLYAINTIDNIDLLSIFIEEEYRRKNFAYELIKYLADNYCYHKKTITLEVNVNNTPAIKLYEKYGFKIVNTRKKYYDNEDGYLMKWGD